jgi:Integrase zinc binding domain
VHGSKARGHWGILRTAAIVRAKYYWKGWAADVESAVAKCMACEIVSRVLQRASARDIQYCTVLVALQRPAPLLKKPGRQGRMMKYHPSRRFELVAVNILEMTPVTRRGNKKH